MNHSSLTPAGFGAFAFTTVPSIVFGFGSLKRIGEFVPRLGDRILVVTDKGIVALGLAEKVADFLRRVGAETSIYEDVVADPPEPIVQKAVSQAKDFGATGIVGLGGGSSLDVAKLVALLACSHETLSEIYGVGLAKGPRLPLLAIPTTAGTGSEVTPIAIVTTGAHEKKGVVSPLLLPDIALLDPELTLGLPPLVTAATGIDAMVHAIEAYTSTSPNNNPLSRMLACEALRLLGRNIAKAVSTGSDQQARSAMLLGSMLAGQAFANAPVAAVHALAYPIGGHFGIPHGLSNALVLPHVMRFNAPACAASYAELAAHAFPHLETTAGADSFIDALVDLAKEIGLPPRLRDVGIPISSVPMMAQDAMLQTRLLVNNPRSLTREDAQGIYEAAW